MNPPSAIYEPNYTLSKKKKGSSYNAFKLHQDQIKNVFLKLKKSPSKS